MAADFAHFNSRRHEVSGSEGGSAGAFYSVFSEAIRAAIRAAAIASRKAPLVLHFAVVSNVRCQEGLRRGSSVLVGLVLLKHISS